MVFSIFPVHVQYSLFYILASSKSLGGMQAGFEYFKSFEQDEEEFSIFSSHKLEIPLLVLTGEYAAGSFLTEQEKLVANNVQGKAITGSSHWLMEEAPKHTIPAITLLILTRVSGK